MKFMGASFSWNEGTIALFRYPALPLHCVREIPDRLQTAVRELVRIVPQAKYGVLDSKRQ